MKVFFSGASKTEILTAANAHSQIIVCWPHCFPLNGLDPDCLIKTSNPVTIVKAPDNMGEILGEYTHVGTLVIPPSQFSQPSRNISLTDGDGDRLPNQPITDQERAPS